jgi:hypothetical protein
MVTIIGILILGILNGLLIIEKRKKIAATASS